MSKQRADEFPLAGYIDGLADRLRKLVPAALDDGEIEAIHQARVTTRRLRAALNLLDPLVPAKMRKSIGKTLRRLRRQLGPLRDADVMLGHLGELHRYQRHLPAIEWMETRLRDRRTAAAGQALKDAPPAKTLSKLGAWWGVREQIAKAFGKVDALLAASLHKQLADFTNSADALAGQTPSPTAIRADPHVVRIAGKLLRYTVEMAAAQGHALPSGILRSFKKMQNALGLWHDYVVLAENAMQISVDELLAAHDAAMQQRVLRLAELALNRSQKYLGKFSELWKQHGPEITDAIRAAFPAEVIEPRTGPDPAGSAPPAIPAASDSAGPAAA